MSIELKGGGTTDLQKITPQGASLASMDHAGNSRVHFQLQATNFTAATTEGLITLTPQRDGVAGATGTSFAVTASKRLRLTGLSVSTKNAGAAGQGVQVRVRVNPSGAAIVSSPVVAVTGAGTYLAIANVVGAGFVDLSFGWIELSGAAQVAISQIGTATAGNDVVLHGYEYTAL